jgi:hypothetical protein
LATAGRLLQHALVAQQHQGLLQRLARNTLRLSDLLLDDAVARLVVAHGGGGKGSPFACGLTDDGLRHDRLKG